LPGKCGATRTGTRNVERVVVPSGVAVLGEQAALIREIRAIFHHFQKIAIFERFFRLKLKRIGW
jgi:hypothetical protein